MVCGAVLAMTEHTRIRVTPLALALLFPAIACGAGFGWELGKHIAHLWIGP